MNGINSYQIYQQEYQKNTDYVKSVYEKSKAGEGADTAQAAGTRTEDRDVLELGSTAGARQETGVTLSENAKKLLEKLKEKYGNMDITVANYGSDEEAQKYLSAGAKEYSLLIEPELLEKMAADEATEKKYTDMIDTSVAELQNIHEQLGDEDTSVRVGITVSADGSMKYFAELEKLTEQQKERIEKSREEKKKAQQEERSRNESLEMLERTKKTRVSADSSQELIEKIRSVDWDQIKAEIKEVKGGFIDLGI